MLVSSNNLPHPLTHLTTLPLAHNTGDPLDVKSLRYFHLVLWEQASRAYEVCTGVKVPHADQIYILPPFFSSSFLLSPLLSFLSLLLLLLSSSSSSSSSPPSPSSFPQGFRSCRGPGEVQLLTQLLPCSRRKGQERGQATGEGTPTSTDPVVIVEPFSLSSATDVPAT